MEHKVKCTECGAEEAMTAEIASKDCSCGHKMSDHGMESDHGMNCTVECADCPCGHKPDMHEKMEM